MGRHSQEEPEEPQQPVQQPDILDDTDPHSPYRRPQDAQDDDATARTARTYGSPNAQRNNETFGYDDPAFDDVDFRAPPRRSGQPLPPPFRPPADVDAWYDGDTADSIPRPAFGRIPDLDDFDEEDLEAELTRRRAPAVAEPATTPAEAKGKNPLVSRKWKIIFGVAGIAVLGCAIHFGHDTDDGKNDHTGKHGMSTATSGPNEIPEHTTNEEPMDTAADRMAHVQRAVNNGNGEFGKTVDVLPGTLTYSGDSGDNTKLKNPIIVTDNLGDYNFSKLASGDADLEGRIFAIEPLDEDPNSGESYHVTAIDPTAITGWKPAPGTEGKMPLEVTIGSTNKTASEAFDAGTHKPYKQTKSGIVIKPGANSPAEPLIVGEQQ
jgi:hypothetical protein